MSFKKFAAAQRACPDISIYKCEKSLLHYGEISDYPNLTKQNILLYHFKELKLHVTQIKLSAEIA